MKNKQPTIRPDQSKPYRKATRREVRQRLNAAAALDYWETEKSDIQWFFQHVFKVEWRQADRYLARARARHAIAALSGDYAPGLLYRLC